MKRTSSGKCRCQLEMSRPMTIRTRTPCCQCRRKTENMLVWSTGRNSTRRTFLPPSSLPPIIPAQEQPAAAGMFWGLSDILQDGPGAACAVDPAWQQQESIFVDRIVNKFIAVEDKHKSRARSRRPRELMRFTGPIEGILKQLEQGLLGQEAREAWSVVTIAAADT